MWRKLFEIRRLIFHVGDPSLGRDVVSLGRDFISLGRDVVSLGRDVHAARFLLPRAIRAPVLRQQKGWDRGRWVRSPAGRHAHGGC